jgi:hypothetical protein
MTVRCDQNVRRTSEIEVWPQNDVVRSAPLIKLSCSRGLLTITNSALEDSNRLIDSV